MTESPIAVIWSPPGRLGGPCSASAAVGSAGGSGRRRRFSLIAACPRLDRAPAASLSPGSAAIARRRVPKPPPATSSTRDQRRRAPTSAGRGVRASRERSVRKVARNPCRRIGCSTKRYDSAAAATVIARAMPPSAQPAGPVARPGRAAPPTTSTNTGQCHR